MLRKLWINVNFNILKTAYHSLFENHLQYGTQLWGQKTMKNNNRDFPEASKPCSKAVYVASYIMIMAVKLDMNKHSSMHHFDDCWWWKFIMKSLITLQNKLSWWSLKCVQRIKIMVSSKLMAAKFLWVILENKKPNGGGGMGGGLGI